MIRDRAGLPDRHRLFSSQTSKLARKPTGKRAFFVQARDHEIESIGRSRTMAAGRKTGGRVKGVPNKATADRIAEKAGINARAFIGLTEDQIVALRPKDVLRLVTQHYVRIGDPANAADTAGKWAPYEHARLAPKIVDDPDAETDEVKAARLANAVRAMRGTVDGN